jgi:hypothetical protein
VWENGLGGFELLETGYVGVGLFQPSQDIGQALVDVVDVESGDFQE